MSKNIAWKHEYDVKSWRHKQRTPNTNDHHVPLNETPHENFLRTPLLARYRIRYFFKKEVLSLSLLEN